MVFISEELPVETERRLRDLIRVAQVVHLDGPWRFRRFCETAPPGAIATVKDDAGWCALVPATGRGGELFGLTRTTFSPAIDNSGFVGWLATTIKQRTGSGVFLVCGDNPARGGIFDYLGYPLAMADEVRDLIDGLRAPQRRDPLDLDLRVFDVVETSPASAVSHETRFEFRESDGIVSARYSGGDVVSGSLTGRRIGNRVSAAYSQLEAGGGLRTGTASLRVEPMLTGIRLIEDYYTWSGGAKGRNVLQSTDRASRTPWRDHGR
jgi:hypothetical protein